MRKRAAVLEQGLRSSNVAGTISSILQVERMSKSTTKVRSNQTRTFDMDGYRKRADAIIFKDTSFTEVLLVSSRSEPDKWTVAGGGVDPGETSLTTCVREAREEAGVIGSVHAFVGSFDDPRKRTRTEVYIVIADQMVDTWDDGVHMDRQRHWFTTEDAIIQTSRRPLKQHYLIAACKQTQLHSQQILQPLSSPSLSPLSSSSSSHSISYRTTLLSSLLLTCTLVLCVGLYNIIII